MIFHFFLLSRSRSFEGQGHTYCPLWKGLVLRDNVCKYEENPSSNEKVMAKVKVSGQTRRQTDRPGRDKNNMPP